MAGSRRFAWDASESTTARSTPTVPTTATAASTRPLPSAADALALLAGVADGTVDAIATDHAPHPPERKLVPFDEAAPGMIGLETALSLGLAAVDGGIPRPREAGGGALDSARRDHRRAAKPCDRPAADLVVFDPGARWRVEASALASASANTPLLGMELPGVVRLTVADGRLTYRS